MSQAPGKSFRKGITMIELFEMFPDNKTAEGWFEQRIWKGQRKCGQCGSVNTSKVRHPTMPYKCRDCKKYFSIKTGSVMEASNVGYQKWAITTYLFAVSLKGVSSMRIHRDLGVTQKTAWFMVHRLREAWRQLAGVDQMEGPVEIDETYVGGSETNRHAQDKGKKTKTVVVGVKDRSTNKISAFPVPETTKARLTNFVDKYVD